MYKVRSGWADHPLENEAQKHCQEILQRLSSQGYYTVAVAYRPLPPQQEDYSPARENAVQVLEAPQSSAF